MKNTLLSLLIGVFLACLLESCSGQQKNVPETNLPAYASATNSLPLTVTLRPTVTPIPPKTSTATSTPIKDLSSSPSVTPLPILGATEAQKMLQFMIYHNGGCELPCWWGITPGLTKRDDTINVMKTFLKKVVSDETSYIDISGERSATSTVVYYNSKDETEYKYIFEVVSVEGVVKRILAYEDLTGQFRLDVLLRKYGTPKQILLTTLAASPNNRVPFNLILYYPDQGILAYFSSLDGGRVQGKHVYICPQSALPQLRLWTSGDPQQGEFEMKNLMDNIGGVYTQFKPIETVSSLSIDEFHAIFQKKNATSCIVTEAEQWWGK